MLGHRTAVRKFLGVLSEEDCPNASILLDWVPEAIRQERVCVCVPFPPLFDSGGRSFKDRFQPLQSFVDMAGLFCYAARFSLVHCPGVCFCCSS